MVKPAGSGAGELRGQSRVLLLSLPYALKLRMPNSRGAAGIRLLRPAHLPAESTAM